MNIFIVNTPYHLLVTSTLVAKKDLIIIVDDFNYDQSAFSKLIVENKFKSNKTIITEGLREKKYTIFKKMYLLNKKIKEVLSVKSDFKNIYLFNDSNPLNQFIVSRFENHDKLIMLEEGIGLYRNIENRKLFIRKIFGKIIFGTGFQNISRQGEYKETTHIICNYPKLLNEKQKKKKITKMDKLDFGELYSSVHLAIGKEFDMSKNETIDIFIGQPLVEDGIVTEEFYISTLKSILDKVIRKNVDFYIKPHPRESIKKYSKISNRVKIYTHKDFPVELMLANMRDPKIYTAYSSAALNISKILNIDTFLLYKLFEYNLHVPNEILKSDNIKVVSSYDSL